jgi:predicted deacylase
MNAETSQSTTPTTYSTTLLRVHQFRALQPGPKLIVLGAVHGSESCGTRGIERVLAEFDSGALAIVRGTATFVPVTNPLAYQKGERNGERNLNRNLRPTDTPQDFEDRIANQLCPLLGEHDVLLDLHSFQARAQPFAMLGPQDNQGTLEPFARAREEQALVRCLGPQRIVEGWLSAFALGVQERLARTTSTERVHLLSTDPLYGVGTTEYLRTQGGYAITLECGQHNDPQAPKVAYQAIRNALAHLGLIDAPAPVLRTDVELLQLTQVVDRYHAGDTFSREWASFDAVSEGTCIATRHDGTKVLAQQDGYIVFPNPRSPAGNEWFYLAQRSKRDIVGAVDQRK